MEATFYPETVASLNIDFGEQSSARCQDQIVAVACVIRLLSRLKMVAIIIGPHSFIRSKSIGALRRYRMGGSRNERSG